MTQLQLKKAPQGYIPACDTQHSEADNVMHQWFPGGRVRFDYDKTTGIGQASVDGRIIGSWDVVTIGMWGDILYTLNTDFKHLIG
ncbi:MAG: hypothetical protein RSD70_03095 [Acidaminococcaceae bacterium]